MPVILLVDVQRMCTNCYFRASDQNSGIAIKFNDPNVLKGSNNLVIRLCFHAMTLTFDHSTFNLCCRSCHAKKSVPNFSKIEQPIQYKFIYMAAISWIKRKTITHEQRHAFKIKPLEVGQRKRYKRVLKTSCPCTNRWIWLRSSQPFSQLWVSLGRQQVVKNVRLITDYTPEH